ncbi:MAG: hypothetical protein JSS04_08705 [Proteobacteria bacterium]|nr:hypothetical protein [Pseudomonadota bacterium]
MAAAGALSNRWLFWPGVTVGFLLLLWSLSDLLLPFVVGAVAAYFFDPVVACDLPGRYHASTLDRGSSAAD